jgi:hypothetical protein
MAIRTTRQRKPTELEAAIALMLHTQVKLAAEMVGINQRYNELKESSDRRFAHIEELLLQHDKLLRALPEAIREKIGFQKS